MASFVYPGVSPLLLFLVLSCETHQPLMQEPPGDGGCSSNDGDGGGGDRSSSGGDASRTGGDRSSSGGDASRTGGGGGDGDGDGDAGKSGGPCDGSLAGGSDGECAGVGGASAGGEPEGASGAGVGEGCELTYSEGHGDLYVTFDGALGLAIRSTFGLDTQEIRADPDRVCVIVPAASYALATAMGGAPESPDYSFLGMSAGQPFWLLPATPRAGMPWFGASTEEVPLGRYADDEIRLVIAATELPEGGHWAAWSTSTFGAPNPIFSTSAKILEHTFPRGAHVHFNWAFSLPGQYTVTFKVEGDDEQASEAGPLSPLRFVVRP